LENHGDLAIVSTQPVARNIWDTAPQFCGLKHDHERLSRQLPLQTNCAAL
jgi:hypothetical protein